LAPLHAPILQPPRAAHNSPPGIIIIWPNKTTGPVVANLIRLSRPGKMDTIMSLTERIRSQALALGFDLAGITPLTSPSHAHAFSAWLGAGYHGEMAYLPAHAAQRADPALLAPGARSLIMLLVNYNPGPPPPQWDDPTHGRIARYAWSRDYHDLIKARLYALDAYIRAETGRESLGKACVDSAPLLERDFAMAAGLGFAGRNTVLITPRLGSWTFLAALLVPEELQYDAPPELPSSPAPSQSDPPTSGTETDQSVSVDSAPSQPFRWPPPWYSGPAPVFQLQTGTGTCGHCMRCLAACPTRAFVGPHVLDSRRCISYLTIELRGPIPRDLRPLMGNWIFGCDVCQEVCPYNRDAAPASWPELQADPTRAAPDLLGLLALDEPAFRARYRGTPILRTKRRGLVRNACIAAGNCPAWQTAQGGDPAPVVPALAALLTGPDPLVAGNAAWALGRLGGPAARRALSASRAALTHSNADPWLREELELALAT
jgi:epoxyqueuosine reductase